MGEDKAAGYCLIAEPTYKPIIRLVWPPEDSGSAWATVWRIAEEWTIRRIDGRIRLWHLRPGLLPSQIATVELVLATVRLSEEHKVQTILSCE